jgi:hypothetical protein
VICRELHSLILKLARSFGIRYSSLSPRIVIVIVGDNDAGIVAGNDTGNDTGTTKKSPCQIFYSIIGQYESLMMK